MRENLLANSSFEGGFREYGGVGEMKVPVDWFPWWDQRATRPEWKPATLAVDSRRVRTGTKAAQWFNNYATHTAGIFQRVDDVTPGRDLRLTAWVQAFASTVDDFSKSDPVKARYRMRIGIDPYGGRNPESTDIVWSNDGEAVQPYDAYQELHVETTARSDRVTVFIWGQAEWPVKHVNAYVDDVVLTYQGGEQPPVPPTGDDFVTRQEFDQLRETLAAGFVAMAECVEG